MEGLRLKNEVQFQSLVRLPDKAIFEIVDLATRNFCNELSQTDIVNSFQAIREQARQSNNFNVGTLMPTLEEFGKILVITEYLVSLLQNASAEDQETLKSVLCGEEQGLTPAVVDKILEDLDGHSRKMRERRWELQDVKYRLVSLSQVDSVSMNLVLVNLQLVYADEHGKKCARNLVMTMEEYTQFNASFLEMCDNL